MSITAKELTFAATTQAFTRNLRHLLPVPRFLLRGPFLPGQSRPKDTNVHRIRQPRPDFQALNLKSRLPRSDPEPSREPRFQSPRSLASWPFIECICPAHQNGLDEIDSSDPRLRGEDSMACSRRKVKRFGVVRTNQALSSKNAIRRQDFQGRGFSHVQLQQLHPLLQSLS